MKTLKSILKHIGIYFIQCIVTAIVLFFLFSLFGCKTPVKTERSTEIKSISTKETFTTNYDSLMQRILTSLAFDYEYTLIEWGKPDSAGVQHKEKEHTFKGSGKMDKEENITQVKEEEKAEKEDTDTHITDTDKVEPVEVLTWWDKIRIKIGGAWITIITLGICLFGGWLLIRYIRGRRQ